MRFSSFITSLAVALTVLVAPSFAITAGIVGGATVNDGQNRPSITIGPVTTAIRVAQADTFMIGSSRDSVTVHPQGYKPFATSIFNSKVPATYTAVTSNKDSIVLCLVGYGDADTASVSILLQGRYNGSTNSTSVYTPIGSAVTYSFTSANTQQVCGAFKHPGILDFRFLGVGQGSTDTSKVLRGGVYDK